MLRNSNNYQTIARRTEIYAKSVIPSALSMWNDLETEIRESDSLQMFKNKLKRKYKRPDVPAYYITGERFPSVHHTRMRYKCSNLNADLFNNHIKNTQTCECGAEIEDAEHYLFKCPRYRTERIQLFTETRAYHPLNVNKLLFGFANLNDEQNNTIFKHVHKFIKNTKRFS